MLNIPRWKVILVSFVIMFSLYTAFMNFSYYEDKSSFPPKINLGLDLKGGSHLLLEINFKKYFNDKINVLKDEVRNKLRTERVGYLNLTRSEDAISFELRDEINSDFLKSFKSFSKDIVIKRDGAKVYIKYSESFIIEIKKQLLSQSMEIIRRRIDETGTREPLIQPQGMSRIILQLPGVDDPSRLKKLLGKTAKLTFHLLNESKPFATEGQIISPPGYKILSEEGSVDEDFEIKYIVKNRVELTGDVLLDAQPGFYQGKAQVNFKFDSIGAKKFGNITSENIGKLFAIVLDDEVISAPVIREPILGGQGVISGNFTAESANDLAILLRAGALPAPLEVIEERTVGPSLGQDSIIAGKNAIMLGVALVMISMIVFYRLFGLVADLALFINFIIIFTALSLLSATLTLPGIAGIVLTMGMAVDSNVLIFERIREESKHDKTIYAIIDNGFHQAFKTIFDSNFTTLVAAIILYNFGSGPVKGFAITLSIGILASMFSALTFTKLILFYWAKRSKNKKISY
ncbi:MAG: protein translocase subunit SecD [Rickettsiales bacterium]|jgi:preprotein translocase subunit SecD|nr:protein translocase subunit SecD [Rickettsiales bacterium]